MIQVEKGSSETQESRTDTGGKIEQFLMMDGGILAIIGLIFGLMAMLDRYVL
jgi:hypothetical protein